MLGNHGTFEPLDNRSFEVQSDGPRVGRLGWWLLVEASNSKKMVVSSVVWLLNVEDCLYWVRWMLVSREFWEPAMHQENMHNFRACERFGPFELNGQLVLGLWSWFGPVVRWKEKWNGLGLRSGIRPKIGGVGVPCYLWNKSRCRCRFVKTIII